MSYFHAAVRACKGYRGAVSTLCMQGVGLFSEAFNGCVVAALAIEHSIDLDDDKIHVDKGMSID